MDLADASQKEIEQEKATKQKAHQEIKALPTRLGIAKMCHPSVHSLLTARKAQEQDKYTTLKQGGEQIRTTVASIGDKVNAITLEKGQLALDYAVRPYPL